MDLNDEIARLNGQVSECEGKIERLNSENERLSITLEGIRSSFDLQGLVSIWTCLVSMLQIVSRPIWSQTMLLGRILLFKSRKK